jgi:hypothetical protein
LKNRWFALTLAVLGCGPQAIVPDTDNADETATETGPGTETETGSPVPCNEADCGPLEWCSGEFGSCIPCMGEIPVINDPPGSCQLKIVDLMPVFIPYVSIYIDGVILWGLSPQHDCAEEQPDEGAYVWAADYSTVEFCELACLAFHSAREVTIRYAPLGCQ